MAAKKRKKTRRSSSRSGSGSKWIAILLLVVMVVFGGYLLYRHYQMTRKSPSGGLSLPLVRKEQPTARPATRPPAAPAVTQSLNRLISADYLPTPRQRSGERLVQYRHYTVAFDTRHRIPAWVAYELTAEEVRGGIKRNTNFSVDPNLRAVSSQRADYTHSGYDRGHLAPAADMAFSEPAMDESFYLTNVAPQNQQLNRRSWKVLEEQVRRWAKREKQLYVVSGTVALPHAATIGKNRVAVPDYFYKAVLSVSENRPKAIGFVFRNQSATASPFRYAVSIDSIESLTGLDLFAALPDSIEAAVEQSKKWGEGDE